MQARPAAATVLTGPSEPAQAQAQTKSSQAPAQAPAQVAAPPAAGDIYLTLTATEAAFLSAAYDTFIPADKMSPSGTDCGLVVYIDRQLAGAWGNGARFYRNGPFLQGKPEQGYQLPLTPREFFAAGIKAANAWTRKTNGKDFDRLAPAERDAALKAMDAGRRFGFQGEAFQALLPVGHGGFFAVDLAATAAAMWRMVGYQGCRRAAPDRTIAAKQHRAAIHC